MPPASHVIVYAAQDHRRSQSAAAMFNVFKADPASADDVVIKLSIFVAAEILGDKHQAQELLASLWVNPQVDADQFTTRDVAAGFLEHSSEDGGFR